MSIYLLIFFTKCVDYGTWLKSEKISSKDSFLEWMQWCCLFLWPSLTNKRDLFTFCCDLLFHKMSLYTQVGVAGVLKSSVLCVFLVYIDSIALIFNYCLFQALSVIFFSYSPAHHSIHINFHSINFQFISWIVRQYHFQSLIINLKFDVK